MGFGQVEVDGISTIDQNRSNFLTELQNSKERISSEERNELSISADRRITNFLPKFNLELKQPAIKEEMNSQSPAKKKVSSRQQTLENPT